MHCFLQCALLKTGSSSITTAFENESPSVLYSAFSLQGEYFIVQDVHSRTDVLSTTGSYGAPNFRKAQGDYPIYGMGQPSLNGFKQVLQRLQTEGNEVSTARFDNACSRVDRILSANTRVPSVMLPFTVCIMNVNNHCSSLCQLFK